MDEERKVRNLVLTVCDLKQQGDVPACRAAAQLVTVGTKIYLHGGADDKQAYGDLHLMEIEKASWRELTVGGFSKPSPRYGHSLNYWNDSNSLVLFGGLGETHDEEILLEDAIPSSFPPPPFMAASGRKWSHRGTPSDEIFFLQADTLVWTEPETTGTPRPSARAMHSATVCKRHLVIYGGSTEASLQNGTTDLFVLSLGAMEWLGVTEAGERPTARTGHKTEYSPSSDKLLMFGGANDDGAMFSLALNDLGTPNPILTWSRIEISNTPPLARSYHTLNMIEDRLFVFAGQTLEENISDLYIYTKQRWCRPLYDGQIDVRAHASAVLHDKLIVFGGVREHTDRAGRGDDKGKEEALGSASQRISKKLFFLNVLEIKEDAADGDFKFKIVTVGDSGVGKSCLLTRFVQDVYSDFHVSTIGVDFKSVVTMIKGKLVTLQLWDTAGQERFSGVTGNYYRNADGFVLVFDVTRRESFEHIEQWLAQIQEHHECGINTAKLLIGNKSDLKADLEVTDSEVRKLADKLGALYVAASAKTASNVDAAFLSAATKLVEIRRRSASQRKTESISGGTSIEGGSGARLSLNRTESRQWTGGCGGCASGGLAGPDSESRWTNRTRAGGGGGASQSAEDTTSSHSEVSDERRRLTGGRAR